MLRPPRPVDLRDQDLGLAISLSIEYSEQVTYRGSASRALLAEASPKKGISDAMMDRVLQACGHRFAEHNALQAAARARPGGVLHVSQGAL